MKLLFVYLDVPFGLETAVASLDEQTGLRDPCRGGLHSHHQLGTNDWRLE
jgi:hypothetical protein